MINIGSAIVAVLAARGAVSAVLLTLARVLGEEGFNGLSNASVIRVQVFIVIGVVCVYLFIEQTRIMISKSEKREEGKGHIEDYIHKIKKDLVLLRLFLLAAVLLFVLSIWLYYSASPLDRWKSREASAFSSMMFGRLMLMGFFAVLLTIVNSLWLTSISKKYNANTHDLMAHAWKNVEKFLINPIWKCWSPIVLQKMFNLYNQYNTLSDSELVQRIEAAGVWNKSAAWFGKGRTLDDAVMLAIFASRQYKDSVAQEALRLAYEKASRDAATAPDPQQRVEIERKIAALQAELAGNVSASGGNQSKGNQNRPKEAKMKTGLEDDD